MVDKNYLIDLDTQAGQLVEDLKKLNQNVESYGSAYDNLIKLSAGIFDMSKKLKDLISKTEEVHSFLQSTINQSLIKKVNYMLILLGVVCSLTVILFVKIILLK